MTTFWTFLQWLGTGGAGVSLATLLGLFGRFIAWRMRVRDIMRYNTQVLAAQAESRGQLKPPPGMPEQAREPDAEEQPQLKPPPAHLDRGTKVLIGLLVVGLSLWALLPALRAGEAIASYMARQPLINAAAREGSTSPTRPGLKPRSKSCSGSNDCGRGCSCVVGKCSCTAVDRKPDPTPQPSDQRADGQHRPVSADSPASWQDTQPEAFPDRDPGIYYVNGQAFPSR